MRQPLANARVTLVVTFTALAALWIFSANRLLAVVGGTLALLSAAFLYLVVGHELTERKRTAEVLAGQNRVLEAIASGAPLAPVLTGITQWVAGHVGAACAIHTVTPDGSHLHPAAVTGLPHSYAEQTEGISLEGCQRNLEAAAVACQCALSWSTTLTDPSGAVLGFLAVWGRPGLNLPPDTTVLLNRAAGLAVIAIQRRQEEERLRLLESAIQNLDEGVMIATADLVVNGPRAVMANATWVNFFGSRDDLTLPGKELRVAVKVLHALSHGRATSGETRYERPGRLPALLEWTVAPVRNEMGTMTHFITVCRDVTEHRSGQEALLRYRLLNDSTNIIVLFSRPATGQIVDANAAAQAAYGYGREELLSMTQWQLRADGVCPPNMDEELARVNGRFEAVHRRKNGERFPVAVTVTVADNGGELLNLVVVQDMTRQKQLQSIQELLHNIDHLILQNQALDEILQYVCEEVVALFGYRMAWIGLKEADGTVRAAAIAGEGRIRVEGLKVIWGPEPNGPTGRAIFTGRTQLSPLEPDPRMAGRPDLAHLFGPWTCLSLPLSAKEQVVGALSLYAMDGSLFDDDTQQHLRQFANQVALSIFAARDQEQINLQTEALEAAANAILIADGAGRALWVNRSWVEMTGYTADETSGWIADWPALLSGGPTHTAREVRRKDGSLFYMDQTITPVRNAEGSITHVISIAQDVTERRQQEEHLRFLALHDLLTGLPNDRALQEGLVQMIARSSPERRGAMILLDLDHFKVVTGTLGDSGGDEVLIALTRLLQNSLCAGDLLVRFGGDQFAVLVAAISPEVARTRAENLRQAVNDLRFQRVGHSVSLSASVGVAMIDGTLDASGVKALAHAALDSAKEAGRNQVAIYQSERDKPTDPAEENRLAADIKEALREDRFRLHFQPVVHLETGHVDHYEVLIRLHRPDGTLLPPGAFLGAAERFRLMPAIDRWVLEQALTLLRDRPHLRLFVNLSGQSLSDEPLLAYTEARLRKSRNLAGRLSFEITETAAVRDIERVRLWMGQLKGLGCRFALDDFGIGFSSFTYLRVLPADFVKIDGSFICNLDTDPTNRSLVEAMYRAAHTLGKVVIAEWVENEAIARVLQEVGIEYGQGYRWGRPGPSLPTDT